jgi:hypothetical protein
MNIKRNSFETKFSGHFYTIAIVFFVSFLFSNPAKTQVLPVGLFETVEEAYRRQMLLAWDSSGVSYMVRPVSVPAKKEGGVVFYPLPVVWKNRIDINHPYATNDGSMISAVGLQTQLSAGFFLKSGHFSIQFRPDFVVAENDDFLQIHEHAYDDARFYNAYADLANSIDMPSRYGKRVYTRLGVGQSSARLTFDPVSFGLSNENLWWGPGSRNSLLMSNNAPGFAHLTLNTSKPIKTPIGSFEGQIVAGQLENSGVANYNGNVIGSTFTEKPGDWRYFSGMVFTYQPKWVKGLFVGFDRSAVAYNNKIRGDFRDVFPIFTFGTRVEDQKDQYGSVFAKYIWTQQKMEIYGQYGRNDFEMGSRDVLDPINRSAAYLVGLKKLFSLTPKDTYIEVAAEVTDMADSEAKDQATWYKHRLVTAGYTHKGQVLGAGIGPGAAQQSLEVNWVRGLKRAGIRFENLRQNKVLSQYGFDWRDLSVAGRFDWNWKQFMLNAQMVYIRSQHYHYEYPGANNVNLQLGILYDFK